MGNCENSEILQIGKTDKNKWDTRYRYQFDYEDIARLLDACCDLSGSWCGRCPQLNRCRPYFDSEVAGRCTPGMPWGEYKRLCSEMAKRVTAPEVFNREIGGVDAAQLQKRE